MRSPEKDGTFAASEPENTLYGMSLKRARCWRSQKSKRSKMWRLCVGVIVGLGFAQLMAESPAPRRDINAVLAAHDRQLLYLPAVVGVYVGVLADGKTPCLKVMLARPTPETERKIPREIEGFPVVTEISGEIRP